MFGEERGCMKLGDLEEVTKVDEKSAGADFNLMFEVKTKTKDYRRFITESEDQCDQWINSIEHAMSKTFQVGALSCRRRRRRRYRHRRYRFPNTPQHSSARTRALSGHEQSEARRRGHDHLGQH